MPTDERIPPWAVPVPGTLWRPKCTTCGMVLDGDHLHDGVSRWQALTDWLAEEWHFDGDTALCPDCWAEQMEQEWTDED